MDTIIVNVEDLKEDDEFWHDGVKHYTVLCPPTLREWDDEKVAIVTVLFADGGTGERVFDVGTALDIVRAS